MQTSFTDLAESHKKVITKKAKFLKEMDSVIPWNDIIKTIKPYHFKANNIKGGRPQYPVEVMRV